MSRPTTAGLPPFGTAWWEENDTSSDTIAETITHEIDHRVTRPMSIVFDQLSLALAGLVEELPPAKRNSAIAVLGAMDDLLSGIQMTATRVVGRCLARFPGAIGTLEETLQQCFTAAGFNLDQIKAMNRNAMRGHLDTLGELYPDLDFDDPDALWGIKYGK